MSGGDQRAAIECLPKSNLAHQHLAIRLHNEDEFTVLALLRRIQRHRYSVVPYTHSQLHIHEFPRPQSAFLLENVALSCTVPELWLIVLLTKSRLLCPSLVRPSWL